jgi:addiction module RelE/StbE family toxin
VTYTVVFSREAQRNLNKLPVRIVDQVLPFISDVLAVNPHRIGKPLTGELAGLWSARRTTFRIVYRIDDGRVMIEVVRIAHRADLYR